MLPYREWSQFDLVTLLRQSDNNADNDIGDWTTEHLLFADGHAGKMGNFTPEALVYQAFHPIFKPSDPSFELVASMDQALDYGFWYTTSLLDNSAGETSGDMAPYVLNDAGIVDYDLVNGKYYDGVNEWNPYPPGTGHNYFEKQTQVIANLPASDVCWVEAINGGTARGNAEQDIFFRNGVYLHMRDWIGGSAEPFPEGKACLFWIDIQKVRVNYLNAVVNTMSRNSMPAAGGVPLVLMGLAFDQDDAELGSPTRFPGNNPARNWDSLVDFIDFIGLQGQGTTTLTGGGVDFTVDSDAQITIPAMPALALGTYAIRLRKEGVIIAAPFQVYSYVGDWTSDSDGLVTPGARRSFLVGEISDPPKPPILTFIWPWIINGLLVDQYYAPIDTRAPETFWDGRVLGVSSLKRGIDTLTGMFNISDINIDLASNDMEFQKLLAQGHCKNQVVEIMHGWTTEPVGWMRHMFHGIVDDYGLQGPAFSAVLKDISRRHFRKTMPRYTVTLDDYPNAHESAVGQGIPDPVGLHSLTTGNAPGTFEALCVDTTLRKYVAAGAPVGLLEVYSAGKLKAPATYAITFEDGGRTYITFTTNQRDKKITFNCTGYSLPAWDDPVSGYIQNPAYVLGFYIIYLCQVPINFVDLESLEEVAQLFIDGGWETIGRLPIAASQDADAYLQELLFSFGIKMWPDMRGRFKFGRKELGNIATDNIIFAQIDTQDAPDRPYNLETAVNYAKARWDYHPAASLWKAADEVANQPAIDFYGGHRHEGTWDYPCITSAAFAAVRINEDLNRLAYGHRVVSFTLPLEFIDELEIFDNFRLQDPFDISATGAGNPGHYYYISSLEYDFQNQKLKVEAEDLQWLMGRCMIIGRKADLNRNYNNATPWQRSFAYVGRCAEGTFANGDPNKQVCKCN